MKSIKETISFKRGEDPKKILRVGQEHLIRKWLDEMGVKNYIINEDFTIDVNRYVDLNNKILTEFPPYIQFGVVNGSFSCRNSQLTSLRGVPKIIGSYFSCSYNSLTTLKDAPKKVPGTFFCNNNDKKFTEEEVRKYTEVKGRIYT